MSRQTRLARAFNSTRQTLLATRVKLADTHWSRLRGLLGTSAKQFGESCGLWIVPCHGVHTLGMSYAIDAIYLSPENLVVHAEENLRPWRVAPIRKKAATVLELPAGTILRTGTRQGDQIEIKLGEEAANA
jgi:uncharacterized membrane protein (UPF0127 family)